MSKEAEYRTLLEQALDTMQSKLTGGPIDKVRRWKCPQCAVEGDHPNLTHLDSCWFSRVKKTLND